MAGANAAAAVQGKEPLTLSHSVMQEQPGDDPLPVFSTMGTLELHPRQVSCHTTHTNDKTPAAGHLRLLRGFSRLRRIANAVFAGVLEQECRQIVGPVSASNFNRMRDLLGEEHNYFYDTT